MDSMGIIAFSVALPVTFCSLAFAVIAFAKYDKVEKRIKELEDKVNEK